MVSLEESPRAALPHFPPPQASPPLCPDLHTRQHEPGRLWNLLIFATFFIIYFKS